MSAPCRYFRYLAERRFTSGKKKALLSMSTGACHSRRVFKYSFFDGLMRVGRLD
jgi:type I site-specific restriction endonuclease